MEFISTTGTPPTSVLEKAWASLRRMQTHFDKSKKLDAKLYILQPQDEASYITKWEFFVSFADSGNTYTLEHKKLFCFTELHSVLCSNELESTLSIKVTIIYDRITELEKRIAILESQIKK
jgi:hypothetical protein